MTTHQLASTLRPFAAVCLVLAALVTSVPAAAQSEDERSFQFAERLYRDGLFELAHEQFERFAADHPRSSLAPQALLLSADSLIQLDRMDDALAIYERMIERYRRSPLGCEAAFKRATILAERGDHQEALRGFDTLRGTYEDCRRAPDALVGAAESLVALGRPDEALARITELPADPERPGLLARSAYARATALRAAGEVGNALAAYDAVIQLFPATIWEDRSHLERSAILAAEGYHAEAMQELESVGGHGHADAAELESQALAARGVLEERLGRSKDAASSFAAAAKLLEERPAERRALVLKSAESYRRAGLPAEGLDVLELAETPEDPTEAIDFAFLSAELAQLAGRADRARSALEELAATADSDSLPPAARAHADDMAFAARLLAAEIEDGDGQSERAAHLLRSWPRSSASAEQRAELEAQLGTIELDRLEQPVEARQSLRRALAAWEETGERAPGEIYFALGRAEEALGEWPEAEEAYRQAFVERPRNDETERARARAAYVRDYRAVDRDSATRALSDVAEKSARGELGGAAALRALADIYYEHLKSYERSLDLYSELVLVVDTDGHGRVERLLYRAGRSAVLAAHADPPKVDKKTLAVGHAYFERLATDYPEDEHADDARIALIAARFEDELGNATGDDPTAHARAYQEFLEQWPRSEYSPLASFRLGTIYRLAGERAANDSTAYATSRDLYAAVVREAPRSDVAPEASYWRAVLDERLGDPLAARSGYQDCLKLYPRGSWATEAHFRLGEIALEARELDAARTHYMWIRDENPEHALGVQSLARLGDCALIEEDFDGARQHYQAMLDADPDGALADQALLRIAESYERQNDPGDAEATLRRFLARFPESPYRGDVYQRLGELRSLRGDYMGAADAWQQYVDTDPEPALARAALFDRAEALRAADEGKEALKIYKELAKVEGDSLAAVDRERARAEEVILLYDLDREKDARKKAERFDKDYPESHSWRLENSLARGNYLLRAAPDKAAAHFDALLEEYGDTPGADRILYGRGLVALGARDFERSVEIFEELLARYPSSSLARDAHFKLATSLYSFERYSEAARHYRRSAELTEDREQRGDALHNLGITLERAERYDEAVRTYKEIEREYADTPRGMRAAFKVGFVYQEWGKLDQAIATYRSVLPRQSGNDAAETQFWIAECYESKGELENAAAEYLKVGYLYPGAGMWPGTARYRAGGVYEQLGRLDDAHAVYRALAEDDPGEWGGRAKEKLRVLSAEQN